MKLTFTGKGAQGALREQIGRPAQRLSEAMAGLVRDLRFRIANRKETDGRPDSCS
jgi:hypothetical protein